MYATFQNLENGINLLFYEGYLDLVYTINIDSQKINSWDVYDFSINFSSDGRYFVYSFNTIIYFYSIDFILIFTHDFENSITEVWISGNNDKLIIYTYDKSLIIFDINLREIVDDTNFGRQLNYGGSWGGGLFVTNVSNNIIAEFDDYNMPHTLYLNNIYNNTEIKNFEIDSRCIEITLSGFSSDTKYFYWSTYHSRDRYEINYFEMLNIYDLENDLVINPHLDIRLVQFVYFIPNTYTLVFKTRNNKIIFYDINSNEFTEFEYIKNIYQILLTETNTLSFIGMDFIDFFDLDEKEIVYSITTNTELLFFKTNSMWYPSDFLLK